jgi:signal transduction histidine kinase
VELSKKGQQLVLHFINNGPSVPADVIQWISGMSQSGGLLKRPAKSGLGLAIVKRILELHDYGFDITTTEYNHFTITMQLYQTD